MAVIGKFAHDKLRLLPAILLLVSFVTHDSQLFIYGRTPAVVIVALFGIFYLVISIFLLRGEYYSSWAGAVVPAIGASLGVYRFLIITPNPFSVFNVALDAIIVPFSVILILRWRRPG